MSSNRLAVLEGYNSGFGAPPRRKKRRKSSGKKRAARKTGLTRSKVRSAFGKAAKYCFENSERLSKGSYGKCMREELKKAYRK